MMSDQAAFELQDDGRIRLRGRLGFGSVPALWDQLHRHCAGVSAIEVDLGGVESADSAGLALLIACMREAQRAGASVRFLNMPAQLLDIARLSSLDEILPL